MTPITIRLTPTSRVEIHTNEGSKTIGISISTEATSLDHGRIFNSIGDRLTESQARNTVEALTRLRTELLKCISVGPDSPSFQVCPDCGCRSFAGRDPGTNTACDTCAILENEWLSRNELAKA